MDAEALSLQFTWEGLVPAKSYRLVVGIKGDFVHAADKVTLTLQGNTTEVSPGVQCSMVFTQVLDNAGIADGRVLSLSYMTTLSMQATCSGFAAELNATLIDEV